MHQSSFLMVVVAVAKEQCGIYLTSNLAIDVVSTQTQAVLLPSDIKQANIILSLFPFRWKRRKNKNKSSDWSKAYQPYLKVGELSPQVKL